MRARAAWLGILAAATLTLAAHPLSAQDKGKTAAAELEAASKAALQNLYASAPLAKGIGPTAHAILVFPKVTKAGLGIGGQYGEGALLKKGTAVAYYKTTGASFGLQAGGQQYRLRDVLHEREGLGATRQRKRFRSRCRTEHRGGGRGDGEDHDHEDAEGRHLRIRLRPEGADGRPRNPGRTRSRRSRRSERAEVGMIFRNDTGENG